MGERQRQRQTDLGQLSYEDGYVYICVCPGLIHSLECGSPPQSPRPPQKPVSFCPCAPAPPLWDVRPSGGVSFLEPCPATSLIFQARGETLLLPKTPCPGCKGKTWLLCPVPSGCRARPQDTLARYPMEEGEIRNWERGRGLAGLTQKSMSTAFPSPQLRSTAPQNILLELY